MLIRLERQRKRLRYFAWAIFLMALSGKRMAAARQTSASSAREVAGVRVAGRFVTRDNRPIPGARVFWIEQSEREPGVHRFTTHTDAQGRFEFPLAFPQRDWNHSVFLMAQSEKSGMRLETVPPYLKTGMPLTLVADPTTTLRVPCVDSAGMPLPHLPLRVRTLGNTELPADIADIWKHDTNAQGDCVLSGLPQGYNLRLTHASELFAPLADTVIKLEQKPFQQNPTLHLSRGGAVSGRVTNAQDGHPVGGVRVEAHIVRPEFVFGGATTDDQGRYHIIRTKARHLQHRPHSDRPTCGEWDRPRSGEGRGQGGNHDRAAKSDTDPRFPGHR
jgi:hypothetical protein